MSADVINLADVRAARDARRGWIVGLLAVGLLLALCYGAPQS